jgi:hypothetical protein
MVRRLFIVPLALALCALGGCVSSSGTAGLALQPAQVDLSGEWTVTNMTSAGRGGGGGNATMTLEQKGQKFSGTYASMGFGSLPLSGSVKGTAVTFSFTRQTDGVEGRPVVCLFSGKIAADAQTMTGHATVGEYTDDVAWTATRVR